MASHLTVTTSSAGISSSKGLNASAGADDSTPDVFAALLGASGPQTSHATAQAESPSPAGLNFGFGGNGEGEGDAEPEAIAATIDAAVSPQATLDAGPALTDIIDGLADLKARLAAGETLDPDALQRLDAALTNLAQALDIDGTNLKALTALPDDASFEARLAAALGPMAESLLGSDGADMDALLKSIGDKLTALVNALNGDAISAKQLAQLGLDTDLDAALTRLAGSAAKPEIAAPALAAPDLKLTEPVLTGKANSDTASAGQRAETPDAPIQASGQNNADRDTNARDRQSGENRPVATAAAINAEAEATAVVQSVPAARADVVTAPRVVQAGYQTSQQQLNLPQLAFELVRQVNDGNARFRIRLDPPELGRIDVRLDIDASGQINARLTVEKAETLDLMQRDQRALERALQQAGLDGAKTNLEFSLKQNPFSGGQQGQDGDGRTSLFGNAETEPDEAPPIVNLYRGNLSASGVNILA